MDRRTNLQMAGLLSLLLVAACNESGRPLSDGNAGPAFNGQAPVMGVKQGQTYVVAAGDTVGTIADRTNTPIRSLIDLNNLQPPYVLQSGQRLVLQPGASAPTDTGVAVGQSMVMPSASPDGSAAPVTAPSDGVSKATLAPLPAATSIGQTASTTAQPTVTTATQAPQSLQSKAIVTQPMAAATTSATNATMAANTAATNATSAATTTANNATTAATNQINAAKTSATTTANSATTAANNAANSATTSATMAANTAVSKATTTATGEPNVAIPDFPDTPTATTATTAATQQLAAVTPTAATGSGQFGWPVQGQVISKFGATADGLRNDGINISAPAGAPVVAAADGVVAYAGNELRGFGNMILIRHANGWVTAYAHNQSLNVQKGDTVKRGQTIARVGQTGNVTAPQLHFEIRKGTSAQDPMKYLGS